VLPEGGLNEASAPRSGIVSRIDVEAGQRVRAGQLVAMLEATDGSDFSVTAPTAGQVGEVLPTVGDLLPTTYALAAALGPAHPDQPPLGSTS
jgi:biotin carboxyl carrier protein